ncbi:MAG: hypothetical protein J6Q94_08530 [Clostridia bacterium]|nr:hypothetical protein [Clostridia bacterium]
MLKKLSAVLLIVITIITLSSCSGDDIFTDENGSEYIIVRDSEGNIVINDSNKLQVYTLNENGKKQKSDSGEYITRFIEFNGQVVTDRTVETAEMRFDIPKYFSVDTENPGYFYYEPYGSEIFISYYNEDAEKYIAANETNCENLLESFGSDVFSYEKYSVKINNTEYTAFRHSCTSSEYYKTAYSFYIPYDTGVYIFDCNIDTNCAKKVNFDKFIKTVELK